MSNLRLSLSWLCLVNLCRLRVEGSGRQCVRCIIRLELQRHLQICRPDQGSPSALRREWECNLECKALNPRFSTETTLVYKDCTYTDIEKSHGWTECDTEDGDQFTVLHVDNQMRSAWDWERNVHSSVHDCGGQRGFFYGGFFWVFWLLRNWIIVGNFSVLVREKIPGLLIKRR